MTKENVNKKLPKWVESVWQLNAPKIYKLCEIKCGNADDAKDLFQTVALKFCQNASRLISKDYALPWLVRVVQNAFYDMVTNRNARHMVLFAKEPVETYSGISEEKGLFFNQKKEDLSDCEILLSILGPLDRMIIDLSYVGGLSCVEIGTILGLSENAIRKRRHLSLEKMRQKLTVEKKAL